MDSIILSEFKPLTKSEQGQTLIYDVIRKRYFILTPEELVRQAFINYLIHQLDYPRSLINVEKEVKLGSKSNRSDIQILTNEGRCFMLIECKSFKAKVNQTTFDQASKYSKSLEAQFLVVTNGITTLCCSIDHSNKSVRFLENLPDYPKV